MRTVFQMIAGPLFWITATYIALTYGQNLVSKLSATVPARNPVEASRSILGSESSQNQPTPSSKYVPANVLSDPSGTAQSIKNLVDQTTAGVLEKGSVQVRESRDTLVASVCDQIIVEVKKQCAISAEETP